MRAFFAWTRVKERKYFRLFIFDCLFQFCALFFALHFHAHNFSLEFRLHSADGPRKFFDHLFDCFRRLRRRRGFVAHLKK